MSDPKAQSYLEFNEGIKKMASSTTILTDSLIAQNDLTFDPTSGKLMDKVLKNLKQTEGNKLLIVGSSQMRVVQGEDIQDAYQNLVSRKIAALTNYNTYNLSIGGMKTPEKLIIAKKGIEATQATRLLISVTPWDCLADDVRPSIKKIESKNYQSKVKKLTEKVDETPTVESKPFPLNINDNITAVVDEAVTENIDIYNKRAAIKRWLNAEIIGTLLEIKEGVKKETIVNSSSPQYWRTLNQKLDNKSGWDQSIAKTGSKSLKITNENATSAKWLGDNIILEKPTDTFEFEGWSKAEGVSKAKLYCIDFQVIFEDGTSKWHYKGLTFKKGTHDWEKVKTRVRFDKKVKAIKPHVLLYGAFGTVWFDDLVAKPVYDDKVGENILPNPSFEEELKERPHVSYTYNDAEWKRIQENMFSVIDFLSTQKTAQPNVLLFTPFWHDKEKTAYPQKKKYNALVATIQQYCKEKNVVFVNASYILTKDNFGIYTKGSVRDKIDVLHFNADAHEKLAKYIIKELNL
ncbi:hypothetical protein KAOT1_16898 [Kordia algicida OT-1]|uniref:Uncharacterized protein n=2 Tax=Kordia TaxID=221065 RepID=A9DRY7_9FLAO|nr:hypothetical protein KAOT1_16898 [Kordia algicida OT-1]